MKRGIVAGIGDRIITHGSLMIVIIAPWLPSNGWRI